MVILSDYINLFNPETFKKLPVEEQMKIMFAAGMSIIENNDSFLTVTAVMHSLTEHHWYDDDLYLPDEYESYREEYESYREEYGSYREEYESYREEYESYYLQECDSCTSKRCELCELQRFKGGIGYAEIQLNEVSFDNMKDKDVHIYLYPPERMTYALVITIREILRITFKKIRSDNDCIELKQNGGFTTSVKPSLKALLPYYKRNPLYSSCCDYGMFEQELAPRIDQENSTWAAATNDIRESIIYGDYGNNYKQNEFDFSELEKMDLRMI